MKFSNALRAYLNGVTPPSITVDVFYPLGSTDPDAYELRATSLHSADLPARKLLLQRAHDFAAGWRACRASVEESAPAPAIAVVGSKLADPNVAMRAKYVGACALLGRVSGGASLSSETLDCIARAMSDCADAFPGRFEVVATSNGGYSLEPIL